MIQDKEMLERIMGAPDSPTGKLVAMRKDPTDEPLETGVWYKGYTRVKEEAERRGLPMISMWTNGDLCGFCRRFTFNILEQPFIDWMHQSNCLFWLGGSMDDTFDEERNGKGFTELRGPRGDVSYFPFVSVVKKGEFEFYGSGHDYDRRKEAPYGTPLVLAKLAEIMKLTIDIPQVSQKEALPASAVSLPVTKTSDGKRLAIRFNTAWDTDKIARFQHAMQESGGHCICQANKTPDTMCMCKAFMESDKPGMCHCGAFEKYIVQ